MSRNFWVYCGRNKVWSAAGVAKNNGDIQKKDTFKLEAGLLWHKVTRSNSPVGLKAEILSFVPATGEPVELMRVSLTNISSKPLKFIPTAAIPLFARSANNLHDHRHVTSLLQRVKIDKYGIIVKPTLSFDESGHRQNETFYFVLGIDDKKGGPRYLWPTQEGFTGEGSDLESPDAVFLDLAPKKNMAIQGKETMAGLKFRPRMLKPGESASYILLLGITKDERKIRSIFNKFNAPAKVSRALAENKTWWQKKSSEIQTNTGDAVFDNWLKWVNTQPLLRRIAGCSFLPDFDYGKGGRGWRDLWQDSLSLLLNDPAEVRQMLVNNFCGVRIDGSNATIIGKRQGEFIADRNNISRVWMDHGIWPLFTTQLYIHQTADLQILLREAAYFKDQQVSRGKELDKTWSPEKRNLLRTRSGSVYKGSILEHILIETLVQFFNVGAHNYIRLEGADWNDGLDMAAGSGESVAFSAMYAESLRSLIEILGRLPDEKISVLKEAGILLDTVSRNRTDYKNSAAKKALLEKYFQSVKGRVSGKKVTVKKSALLSDLEKKAESLERHIRKDAWLKEGFFNGYYDNASHRVEGRLKGLLRMTLTAQVFPLMSGIATKKQCSLLIKNVNRYLKDKNTGGLHLNTDFKKEQLGLGRAFSFVYGDKENGAFFNHMCVMFAYALYKQGFVSEGFKVMDSIYRMSVNTRLSKIYPCLPEYFDASGRGMYSYLTGSASWFVFTLLTQAFGVRGEYGDLLIEPKLVRSQFKGSSSLKIRASFCGKKMEVEFHNPKKKDYGEYLIQEVRLNGKPVAKEVNKPSFLLSRIDIRRFSQKNNLIKIILS